MSAAALQMARGVFLFNTPKRKEGSQQMDLIAPCILDVFITSKYFRAAFCPCGREVSTRWLRSRLRSKAQRRRSCWKGQNDREGLLLPMYDAFFSPRSSKRNILGFPWVAALVPLLLHPNIADVHICFAWACLFV